MLLRGRRGHRKDAGWMWKPRGNNVHKYSRNLLLLILPKIRFMQYYQYIPYWLKINVHYTTHPQSYIHRTRKCVGAEKKYRIHIYKKEHFTIFEDKWNFFWQKILYCLWWVQSVDTHCCYWWIQLLPRKLKLLFVNTWNQAKIGLLHRYENSKSRTYSVYKSITN